MTDAKASTKVTTVDVPESANVPATYAGVVVKASQERGRGQGVPRLVRRTRRPGDPGHLRVPAALLMRGRGRVAGCGGHDPGEQPAERAAGGIARSRRLAALFALFLGLPVVTLVARAVLDGSLATAIASPVVLDALWLSLVTTAISLVITVVLGLPLAFVMARRQFRGKGWLEAIVDLPIVLPPSVAGSRCCWSSAGEACSRSRSSSSASRSRSRPSP